jgi:hypothetical protein
MYTDVGEHHDLYGKKPIDIRVHLFIKIDIGMHISIRRPLIDTGVYLSIKPQ